MSPGGFSAQHDAPLLCHREGRAGLGVRVAKAVFAVTGGRSHGWLAVRGQRGRCPSRA